MPAIPGGCPCVRCRQQRPLNALAAIRKDIMSGSLEAKYRTIQHDDGSVEHTFILSPLLKEPEWMVEFA
jgi:hypothetical protein